MAISTYAELQGAIEDWLARSDITDARVADCITLFEAVANRRLRTRQMLLYDALSTSSGQATLPTDFLAWVEVAWEGSTRRILDYAHTTYWSAAYPTTPSGQPVLFTIAGETLYTIPIDDTADIGLTYYQKIPALSASNTTNWLLTAHPDVYLFGSLVEACGYTHDEVGLVWKARRDEIFTEIERLSEKYKAPTIMRLWGSAP
jgi:hypothetical protein